MTEEHKKKMLLLKDEVVELRHRYRDFFSELKSIPHLPLDVPRDFKAIREQCLSIDEWCPVEIEGTYWPAETRRQFALHNRARALAEFIPDSRLTKDVDPWALPFHLAKFREDARPLYFKTDLAPRVPAVFDLISRICDYHRRIRLVKISSNYVVDWHSHHYSHLKEANAPYSYGVLQMPILTNSSVIYNVKRSSRGESDEYPLAYEEGGLYLFNSYYFHSVHNRSPKERITLFMQFDLEYEPMIRFLLPFVERYRGPRIKPSSSVLSERSPA